MFPAEKISLIECPRDAMQGWKHFIPTKQKVAYLNALLEVGFDTIDFGSFVSPKAIPQMADTKQVITQLKKTGNGTRLLAIVANERGAGDAMLYDAIDCVGFPFSISETFQQRNTNSGIEASLSRVEAIQELCVQHNKQLVVYLSMGFGNPYGDPYNEDIVVEWVNRLVEKKVSIISLADTVGLANAGQVGRITKNLVQSLPQTTIGVHLHATALNWKDKVTAALEAGCKRFDGALKGIGGCPMAGDELVGNMDTELMIPYFETLGVMPQLNQEALERCKKMAADIFS